MVISVRTMALGMAFLGFLTLVMSNPNMLSVTTTFMKNKITSTYYATMQPYSQVQCIGRCLQDKLNNKCNIAGYDKAAKACYLSGDSLQDVVDVGDEMSGVFVMPENGPVLACTTEDQLVSGSNPIPDTHMTASTEYSASWAAYYARLNGVNAWLPTQAERDTVPPNFYIQVQFLAVSNVVAAQTQGHPNGDHVKSYRLQYSNDCASFQDLVDADANIVVFSGNTDGVAVVTNPLSTPIVAMCFRLYPLTWSSWPDLRLDFIGCSI